MTTFTVSASARVAAPPERTYAIIADYHSGHPRILPPAFTSLIVEKGGIGAGTVIRVRMRVLGRSFEFQGFVSEPTPGRTLIERNVGRGAGVPDSVTSFIVDPGGTSDESIVTISSDFTGRSGVRGAIERLASSMLLRRMYREELRLLDKVARNRSTA